MPELILALELIGTIAFAISGAVVAVHKGMDVFGVTILGLTTAVGGGVVRDLLLGNTPPVTFREPVYALTALAVSIVVFLKPVRTFLTGNQQNSTHRGCHTCTNGGHVRRDELHCVVNA